MSHTTVLNVLIADDEASIRDGLKEAIPWTSMNAVISHTAENGPDTLALLLQYHPDIAVIDIKMPGMSGLEVIQACCDAGLDTQFIILSGYNEFSYAQKAIRYGVREYFLKPVNIPEMTESLMRICHDLLKGRSLEGQLANHSFAALQKQSRIGLLDSLVKGELRNSDDIHKRLANLHVKIADIPSAVFVFSVCSENPLEPADGFLSQAVPLIAYHLQDYPFELWPHDAKTLLAVLNLPASSEEPITGEACQKLVSILNDIASACLASLKQLESCRAAAGISAPFSRLYQAPQGYTQALLALSYQIYDTKKDVFDSRILCTKAPPLGPSDIRLPPLLSAIRSQDTAAICQFCEAFCRSLFYVEMPPPSFVKGMCIHLITSLHQALAPDYPEASRPLQVSYNEINQFSSFSQIREWMESLFVYCSQRLKHPPSAANDPVITAAKAYIKDHIQQPIKARDVAAAVHFSESYFTVYFKTKTGVNFRDFLLETKLDYAKILLSSRQKSISEVAYEIGYTDYRSFSRAFKHFTGKTPSEYVNQPD